MPAGAIYDYQRVSVIDMQLNLYWDDNAKWKFTYYLYIIRMHTSSTFLV